MEKVVKRDLDILDPKFKKEIEKMLNSVHASISMLYEAATQDVKTGIYNFSFFNAIFKMEFEKAKRGNEKLSLLVIDIDFFKKINDAYGHVKADVLLKKLADVLKKSTRGSDVVARFGGEEFVVLFSETSLVKAKQVVARMRNNIKKEPMLKKHGLNVSGGLTEYKKGDTMKRMMSRADKSLYEAKKTGRDKIVVK